MRTIVVWKHIVLYEVASVNLEGCVRTIVVWKLPYTHKRAYSYSGCVRTIVVWKLEALKFLLSFVFYVA